MNFIVDEQLPPALARWIASRAGCTAAHIFDFGLRSKPDELIGETVKRSDAVLVTKDQDFVAEYRSTVDRMIWVRCGNIVNAKLLVLFDRHWDRVIVELETSSLVEVR